MTQNTASLRLRSRSPRKKGRSLSRAQRRASNVLDIFRLQRRSDLSVGTRRNRADEFVLFMAAVANFDIDFEWKVFLNDKTRVLFATVDEKLKISQRKDCYSTFEKIICAKKNGSEQPCAPRQSQRHWQPVGNEAAIRNNLWNNLFSLHHVKQPRLRKKASDKEIWGKLQKPHLRLTYESNTFLGKYLACE